ncbi:MAG: oligopeptide/dipeptide ABC transporter ATP-binding protein, partial [Actinomycetota bacterium]
MDIEHAVGHPLRIHRITRSAEETRARVVAALDRVGLSPVDRFLGKFPADLSGGQKQRAVIARAVILEPELLVADEPVSMLDMSVRAKILELMLDLRRDLNLTYVYITHDLATAKFCCDRVAIMYLGRVVEIGPTAEIFANPRHPYTQALLRAVPEPDPRRTVPRDLPRGEVPDAARPPRGCSFHPRCPAAFEVCGWEGRDLRALLEARWTRLGEPTYEAEAAVVGDLAGLEQTGDQLRLRPAGGHRAEELLGVLTALRADDPTERFWTGVSDLRLVDGTVVGAIGVSGASSAPEDSELAEIGRLAAEQAATRPDPIVHLPRQAVAERLGTGGLIVDRGTYAVDAGRRTAPGAPEVHERVVDIMHVVEGRAQVVTGGRIEGDHIEGGTAQQLEAGDVLVVPSGVPHQFVDVTDPFLYLVAKVET